MTVHFGIKNFQSIEFMGNRKDESLLDVLERMAKFKLNNLPVYHSNLKEDAVKCGTTTKRFNRQMIASTKIPKDGLIILKKDGSKCVSLFTVD